jgi:hypothetical protein
MEQENYKFPDEEDTGKPSFEVEVEDDTPPDDRGRTPSQPEYVESLEKDELDEYSASAKEKIAGFRKIYHDERRAKEAADRERQEAIDIAKKLYEENKALKGRVNSTERVAVDSYKISAEQEMVMAKKEYREAYEAGDADKLIEAQEKMTNAKLKMDRALNASENLSQRKALQEQQNEVQIPQQRQQQAPVSRDEKAAKWQEKNSWFGQDDEMTSLALGLHEKLVKENGMAYATTDEYYRRIDETVRRRFPENFEGAEDEKPTTRSKPSTVVASASRSTSSKKIRLSTSQQNIAKKLGLTNEQYALELLKVEI